MEDREREIKLFTLLQKPHEHRGAFKAEGLQTPLMPGGKKRDQSMRGGGGWRLLLSLAVWKKRSISVQRIHPTSLNAFQGVTHPLSTLHLHFRRAAGTSKFLENLPPLGGLVEYCCP